MKKWAVAAGAGKQSASRAATATGKDAAEQASARQAATKPPLDEAHRGTGA